MKSKAKRRQAKKKFNWKLFSIGACLFACIGVIVGFFADWSHPKWIFIAGSSTMQPMLEDISNVYKGSEISVNSGGSSYGITSLINNKKNIASVSKIPSVELAGLPDEHQNAKFAKQWQEDGIKTITISKDSIALIYKSTDSFNIDNNNIKSLYKAFAGYEEVAFKSLNDSATNSKMKVVPFGRVGGSKESGTAEAFIVDNHLTSGTKTELEKEMVTTNSNLSVWTALESGRYGHYTQLTNESSLETWNAIKEFKDPNAVPMTYLNASFVLNNMDEITNSGFKVATYGPNNDGLTKDGAINENYNWSRPLNLLIKTKNLDKDIKHFIQWTLCDLLINSSAITNIYNNLFLYRLNATQIKTMFLNSNNTSWLDSFTTTYPNGYEQYVKSKTESVIQQEWSEFWKSDYEIYTQQKTQRENKEYFGAILGK